MLNNAPVTVGTTTAGTIFAVADDYTYSVQLNNNGGQLLYVGTTTTSGYPVAAGASLSLTLQTGDVLYGIATGGTTTVRLLSTRSALPTHLFS